MHRERRVNDAVQFFVNDLGARIVADSGIASDRYHLGKLILQSLKDAPEFVLQIDGATGKSETNGSVLNRTVQCANSLRAMGLKRGDVMVLMAPNHLDLAIPYYAALYLGLVIAPVDRTLTTYELTEMFKITKAKIVFCQTEKTQDIEIALKESDTDARIVTFEKSDNYSSFQELLKQYGDDSVNDFEPDNFDPEDTIALLISTSGTTGLPKFASTTHKNFAAGGHYLWSKYDEFPTPSRLYFVMAPLQWLTSIANFNLAPVLRYTLLLSSQPITPAHVYHLINAFKPTSMSISPTLMTILLKPGDRDGCDFTCFEFIAIGGSAVPSDLIEDLKILSPKTDVFILYGMTEITTLAFHGEASKPNACGNPVGHLQVRLVNVETDEDIIEPNVPGELWFKGPSVFKGYYNDPEATNEVLAEDGWYRTGDTFYRDEDWSFYFVERIKMLLKYKSYHVSPVELENVIRQHPGVLDVAVSGVPDPECGDLIVACVVRRAGHSVTAQDIKDVVKESLTDTKHLRGGVVFLDEIPVTASTKIHRRKLKEMVLHMKRE